MFLPHFAEHEFLPHATFVSAQLAEDDKHFTEHGPSLEHASVAPVHELLASQSSAHVNDSGHSIVALLQAPADVHWTLQSKPAGQASIFPAQFPESEHSIVHTPGLQLVHGSGQPLPVGEGLSPQF